MQHKAARGFNGTAAQHRRFKILLFILVDGWNLIVGSLMTSVVAGGVGDGSELSRAGPAGHWAETGLLETVWSAGAAVGLC